MLNCTLDLSSSMRTAVWFAEGVNSIISASLLSLSFTAEVQSLQYPRPMHPQLAAAISKTTGRNRKASRTARTNGDEEPREPGALWGLSSCPADQKMRKKHTLVVCWPLAPAICPHTCTSLSGPGFLVTGGHTSLARRKALIVWGRGGGGAG